jgi:transposase
MEGERKAAVRLTAEQRQRLEDVVRNGHSAAKRITHARILLLSDQDHAMGRYTDVQIAGQLGVHEKTVARTRKNFRRGEAVALDRKARLTPPVPPKLDGAGEAVLAAVCCSPAPDGRRHWTMQLLADELVKRKVVVSICAETVRTVIKKTNCSPGGSSGSASPKKTSPASSRRWKTRWTSTPSRRTRSSRW